MATKKVVRKTIPIRGIKQDWYGDKEQEILKLNKKFALKSISSNLLGYANFDEYKSFLVNPDGKNVVKHIKSSNRISKKG
jgi:hypothetical protein